MKFIPGHGTLRIIGRGDGIPRSNGAGGPLIIGPYITLGPGRYQVEFEGGIHSFGMRGVQFDVVCRDPILGPAEIELARVTAGKLHNGVVTTLSFTINVNAVDVEFRVIPSDGADVSISSITFQRIEEQNHKPNRPVWVLVTGTVRDVTTVTARLNFLGRLKREGVIDQVVLSTWQGEFDAYPELLNIIGNNDFQIVQSAAPELVCLGHFLHQMVALDNGLAMCPDDSFVLKSRTDKSGPAEGFYEDRIEQFLAQKNFAHPCHSGIHTQMYKIGLMSPYFNHSAIGPSLCMWHDQTYFGHKSDLMKLVNFNVMAFDLYHMAPEQALFGHPLISRYTAFQKFFRASDNYSILLQVTWNLAKSSAEKLRMFSEEISQNRLFRRAIITERVYLADCFFNLTTNETIEADFSYRGIDLLTFEDTTSYLKAVLSGRDMLANYREDELGLGKLISDYFGIHSRHLPVKTETDPCLTVTLPPKRHDVKPYN